METVLQKISVIVPVYNVEDYLHKCIDSILSQTYSNFELLLIDDGSTDNSAKICDQYAQKDFRVEVFHKVNGGVSAARNLGIENAIGEWICFVDSDDWIESEVLHDVRSKIENKIVDLVIWGYKLAYPKYSSEINVPCSGFFSGKTEVYKLLIQSDMKKLLESPCNKLYCTSIIKDNSLHFDTNLSLMEDSKFNWSYFNYVQSIYAINEIYYNYRINHNRKSLSSKYIDNILEIKTENVAKRLNFFINYDGKYKKQYLSFLEKDIEMAHLDLILAMYENNVSVDKRRASIKRILNRDRIDFYRGGFIYKILITKNVIFIDIVLKLRYFLNQYVPHAKFIWLYLKKIIRRTE